jgi:hypothetical protein
MNPVRDKIWSMTEVECRQILAEYEDYEKAGYIGTSLLRDVATELATYNTVSSMMYDVAFECYRKFYEKSRG